MGSSGDADFANELRLGIRLKGGLESVSPAVERMEAATARFPLAHRLRRSALKATGGVMPFGCCPVCGAGYHMSAGLPVEEWYNRYWPGVPVGAEVPGECIRCWVPLRVGHRVTVRVVPDALAGAVSAGTAGVVSAVEPGAVPAFVVEFQGAGVARGRFRRSELWYVVGQPAVPRGAEL